MLLSWRLFLPSYLPFSLSWLNPSYTISAIALRAFHFVGSFKKGIYPPDLLPPPPTRLLSADIIAEDLP